MDNTDFLRRKLQSSDAEDRREAAVDLSRAGRKAVPLLMFAVGDADWRVRKTAVEALVAARGADVIEGLIHTLGAHDNAGARNSAIEALIHIGAEALDALVTALKTPDVDVRKFIVDILGDMKDPRAVPNLITLLDDPDENIRVAAAEALGKIKDRRAVDALLPCLTRSDQSWLDYAAAEALGEIGDERALGPLLTALGRSSLREPVLESLGKIGNLNTLAPLIAGLADTLRIVREVSVVALATIFRKSGQAEKEKIVLTVKKGISDRAVDFLEELLITSGGELQKASVSVLGWAGSERSIRKLLSLLREEDLEEPVAQALRNLGSSRVRLLLDHLTDGNALVRRVVARVLGEIGSSEAEAPLIGLLADENGHVRSNAAEALGRLRSRNAVKPLLALLEDEYESVHESAIHALADIGDESVLDSLVKDFTARDAAMRRNIVLLLGKFATEKASDALVFALKDEEPEVRQAVVQALGNLPAAKAVRPLLLAITDDDPEVRMLAVDALGKSNGPHVQETLIPLLEDEDLWVRAAAARGLGRTGGAKVGKILVEHLGKASDIFLLALIEVLGKLRAEDALGPLLKLAEHVDPEVRKTVLSSLSAYNGPNVQDTVIARLSDPHWSVRKAAVDILKMRKEASAGPILEKMAEEDPDNIVRQAARDALRS
jgi:HEAT repeat protein